MTVTLEKASAVGGGQELLTPRHESLCQGLAIDPDILFSNRKGVRKKGIEKRQKKLLAKVTFLKSFLEQDEKIIQVTTGCSPVSLLELFLTGWVVYYLKRSLFVFTNKRTFQVLTKPNFSYRQSIAHEARKLVKQEYACANAMQAMIDLVRS